MFLDDADIAIGHHKKKSVKDAVWSFSVLVLHWFFNCWFVFRRVGIHTHITFNHICLWAAYNKAGLFPEERQACLLSLQYPKTPNWKWGGFCWNTDTLLRLLFWPDRSSEAVDTPLWLRRGLKGRVMSASLHVPVSIHPPPPPLHAALLCLSEQDLFNLSSFDAHST